MMNRRLWQRRPDKQEPKRRTVFILYAFVIYTDAYLGLSNP